MDQQDRLYFLKKQLHDLKFEKKSKEVISLLKLATPDSPETTGATPPNPNQPYQPGVEGDQSALPNQEELEQPDPRYNRLDQDDIVGGTFSFESLTEEQKSALSQIFTPQFNERYSSIFGQLTTAITEDLEQWYEIRHMISHEKEYTEPWENWVDGTVAAPWRALIETYRDMQSHFDSADSFAEDIDAEMQSDIINALEDGIITDSILREAADSPEDVGVQDDSDVLDNFTLDATNRDGRIGAIKSYGISKSASLYKSAGCTAGDWASDDGGSGEVTSQNAYTVMSYECCKIVMPLSFGEEIKDRVVFFRYGNNDWRLRDLRYTTEHLASYAAGIGQHENIMRRTDMEPEHIQELYNEYLERLNSAEVGSSGGFTDFGDLSQHTAYRETFGTLRIQWTKTGPNSYSASGSYNNADIIRMIGTQFQEGRKVYWATEPLEDLFETTTIEHIIIAIQPYTTILVEATHIILDVAGLLPPPAGPVFDLENATLYAIRKEYLMSALCLLTMIPILDIALTGAKWSYKAGKQVFLLLVRENAHLIRAIFNGGIVGGKYVRGLRDHPRFKEYAEDVWIPISKMIDGTFDVRLLDNVSPGQLRKTDQIAEMGADNAAEIYARLEGEILAREAAEEAAEEAMERAAREAASREAGEGAAEEVAERATERVVLREGGEEVIEEASEEIIEETSEAAVRESLEQAEIRGAETVASREAAQREIEISFPRSSIPSAARAAIAQRFMRIAVGSGPAALSMLNKMWKAPGRYQERIRQILSNGKQGWNRSWSDMTKWQKAKRIMYNIFIVWLPWISASVSVIIGARARIRLKEQWDALLEDGILDEELNLLGISTQGMSPGSGSDLSYNGSSLIPIENLIFNPSILSQKAAHHSRGCPQNWEEVDGEIQINYLEPSPMRRIWNNSIGTWLWANTSAGSGVISRPGGAPELIEEGHPVPEGVFRAPEIISGDPPFEPVSIDLNSITTIQDNLLQELTSASSADTDLITSNVMTENLANEMCSGKHLLAIIKVARWCKVVAMNEIQYSAMKSVFLSDFAIIYGRARFPVVNGMKWTIGDVAYNIKLAQGEHGTSNIARTNYIRIESDIQQVAANCIRFLENIMRATRLIHNNPEAALGIDLPALSEESRGVRRRMRRRRR